MLVFCSEDCPVLHVGHACALLLSGPGPVRNGPFLFLSRRNHLCHMTIVFSCFALDCQDLYLEELESDWNPEQELCQGETECLHCYSKQRSAFRRLRPGHISVHMNIPICAVWSSQTNETHLRFHGHRCHCSPGALAAGTGRIGKDWAGFWRISKREVTHLPCALVFS